MANSKVQVCNRALVLIGESTIQSFQDGTAEAQKCNLIYDDVVEEVLSEGEWITATTRASLNKTNNTPVYGFKNEFQLPTLPPVVKVISLNGSREMDIPYAIEGDKLLTDESTAEITYVGFLDNPSDYGPYLTRVIVVRLAADLAYLFSGSTSLQQRMFQMYRVELDKALSTGGQQGSPGIIHNDSLIKVRY